MKKLFAIIILAAMPLLALCGNRIVVSKKALMLYVINEKSDTIFQRPIACGENFGNKTVVGDKKTPEGDFKIKKMYDATSWKHDFGDGKGVIEGAYGPYFIRLAVPGFTSIGIHGTCFPESIGTMSTEGCIRCRNEDISKFVRYISIGSEVTILPDKNLEIQ